MDRTGGTTRTASATERARGSSDKRKGKGKGKGKKKPTQADKADKYVLYQESVQNPEYEVVLLKKLYKDIRGKSTKPMTLREDFSGTGAISCEWVKGSKDRESFAVDLEPECLEWGTIHNLSQLKRKQQERVHFIEGDVRDAVTPRVDIIAALNFSYFIFKTRDELRDYFKAARSSLDEDGIFVCDMFGGYEVHEDDREETHRFKGFRYVWDQHKLNPITNDYLFYIHFRFKDGSRLEKAFEYDWRLWSIPEVSELMLEAGYSKVDVFWEEPGDDGEGNGKYHKQTVADADPAWLAYIVGSK